MEQIEYQKHALEEAIKYPKYSDNLGQAPNQITEKEFSLENINTNLIQYDLEDKNLILDILNLLDNYKSKYRLSDIGSIKFAWKGLPILLIKISENYANQNMMYIELKIYKSELSEKLKNTQIGKLTLYFIGGAILLIGGLITIVFLNKSKN